MIRYFGGKKQIGKDIAEKIIELNRDPRYRYDTYFEPFLGAGGVMIHMRPHFHTLIGNDINSDMICLWDAVLHHDWHPPSSLSKDEWESLKQQRHPSPLKTFASIAPSWGGSIWQGYVNNPTGRDYVAEAARSIEKNRKRFEGMQLYQHSYDQFYPRNLVIYADPPYEGTRGFNGLPAFDSASFWETMRKWSKDNLVLVSEESAPSDFVCIFEKSRNRSFGYIKKGEQEEKGKEYKKAPERLFVHSFVLSPPPSSSTMVQNENDKQQHDSLSSSLASSLFSSSSSSDDDRDDVVNDDGNDF